MSHLLKEPRLIRRPSESQCRSIAAHYYSYSTAISARAATRPLVSLVQVPRVPWELKVQCICKAPLGPATAKRYVRPCSTNQAAADPESPSSDAPDRGIFQVFSDPACNRKLLALAVGQMLCSVATYIHDAYLPIYVQDELHMTNTQIGGVQGLAQFLCQLSKGVAGVTGDMVGSQVRVLLFGTGLTLACKPMFALLSSVYSIFGVGFAVTWFFWAKLMDRMSKGIREAPAKAIMNELAQTSGDVPDAAYGLRESLGTAGALLGTSVASAVFLASGHSYILTFTAASIPPAIAFVWLKGQFKDELTSSASSTSSCDEEVQGSDDSSSSDDSSVASGSGSGRDGGSSTTSSLLTTSSSSNEVESGSEAIIARNSVSSSRSGSSSDLCDQSSSNGMSREAAAAAAVDTEPPGAARGLHQQEVAAAVRSGARGGTRVTLRQKAGLLVRAFKPAYWQALLIEATIYFARFDASFVSLRAKQVIPKSYIPMLFFTTSLVQTLLTAPLAKISGKGVAYRNRLLQAGFLSLVLADMAFAMEAFANIEGMFLGAGLLGLHMALTHSTMAAMLASYMPTGRVPGLGKLSGTSVSFTDFMLGFVLVASNVTAGYLSDLTRAHGLGNVGCFAGGAVACCLAALLLFLFSRFGHLGRDQEVMASRKAK